MARKKASLPAKPKPLEGVVYRDSTSELREARRKNQLLREQMQGRRLELQNKLLESYSNYDWVAAYADMLDRFRGTDMPNFSITSYADRKWGKDFPIFQTEQDLALLRMPSRILTTTNNYAIGLLEGLTSYVVKDGFQFRAQSHDNEHPELAEAVQKIIDCHMERNEWHGGEAPGIEEEFFQRSSIDGEAILVHFMDSEGWTDVRFAEPEMLTQPPGGRYEEWSFGVNTDPDDVQCRYAYWLFWGLSPADGEEIEADRVVHLRCNTPRTVKRGLPDFCFDTLDALRLSSKLRQCLTTGAAIQAAIVGVREHEISTQTDAQNMTDVLADYTRVNPVTGQSQNFNKLDPGTWLDVGKSFKYVPPPGSAQGSAHVEILQASLRGAGVRWNAPEWLGSGDASNNNFASSLTAESPFVRTVERKQKRYKGAWLKSMWIAVCNRIRARGGLRVFKKYEDGRVGEEVYSLEQVRRLVEIICEPPSLIVRDRNAEAQRHQIYLQNRVESPQVVQQELGLKTEQIEDDWKKWDEQMGAGGGGMGFDMPPGGEPPGAGGGPGGPPSPFGGGPGNDGGLTRPTEESREPKLPRGGEQLLLESGFSGTVTDKLGRKINYVNGKRVKSAAPAPAAKRGPKDAAPAAGQGGGKGAPPAAVEALHQALEEIKANPAKAVYKGGKKLWHFLETPFRKGKEIAVQAAKERGLDAAYADRVGKVLGYADLISAWTVNFPAVTAATGNPLLGKASSWVPVASLGYILYSGARNPQATLRAARKVVTGKTAVHESAESKPSMEDMAAHLLERIRDGGDWYEALLSIALDDTHDLAEAIAKADAAFEDHPQGPDDLKESRELRQAETILLEAGFTGTVTDKRGRKLHYVNGKRVANPDKPQTKPRQKKQQPEQLPTKAQTSEDLDALHAKVSAANGRGGLGVAGLKAIAKDLGVKGHSGLRKAELVAALKKHIEGARAAAPQKDLARRLELVAKREKGLGVSYKDNVLNTLIGDGEFGNEHYAAAMQDVLRHGGNAKASSLSLLNTIRNDYAERLVNGDFDDELPRILGSMKGDGYGDLNADEFKEHVLGRKPQGREQAPQEKEILPPLDQLRLEPLQRRKRKADPDYGEKIRQELEGRVNKIKAREKVLGLSFRDSVINGLIADGETGNAHYSEAMNDVLRHGDNAKAKSKSLLDTIHRKYADKLAEGDFDEDLPHLLGRMSETYGTLSPREFHEHFLKKGA